MAWRGSRLAWLERMVEAWRRVRFEQTGGKSTEASLLDGLVEPLTRETRHSLCGVEGSAWSRCSGVLRLASNRGLRALYDEFASLRQRRSWCALGSRWRLDPESRSGGLVVELFERQPKLPAKHAQEGASVH